MVIINRIKIQLWLCLKSFGPIVNPCSDVRYLEIGLSAAAFLNVIDHGGPLRLVPKGKFSLSEKKSRLLLLFL